jgi:signal recognition particle receptor subunit beta
MKFYVLMRVTTKQIEILIQSAKSDGASADRISALEKMLEKRRSLKSIKAPCTDEYMVEEMDEEGKKVVYYSTAPLSKKSKAYLDKY